MIKKEFVEERRIGIIQYINHKKRASVSELAEYFNVTEVTIRRDLILLEQEQRLVRTHGGAMSGLDRSIWQITNLFSRLENFAEEKRRIAEHVATLIKDGESLFIDSGSTALLVAQSLLSHRRLLIVTNSPSIAQTLAGINDNRVIIVGGEFEKTTDSIIGTSCENNLQQYRTDKAIIGISGILIPDGYFAAEPQEASIKRIMADNAKYSICISDSSKIGTTAFSFVHTLKEIDLLITDTNIKDKDLTLLQKHGAKITTV
ncbi:MAG: DeoR/GlpR family DNA-binding transcription regulator [Sphaerochaeta sp.]|nr:DeoR/GlpR family DNA-binding transcription regulator [Sphaerochaeta sp.]